MDCFQWSSLPAGGLRIKSPGSLRSLRYFFCPLPKASFGSGHKKIPHFVQDFFMRAQDWIRTSTSLRTLRPEHSASTNFATWAVEGKYTAERQINIYFNMNLTPTFMLILIFSKSICGSDSCAASAVAIPLIRIWDAGWVAPSPSLLKSEICNGMPTDAPIGLVNAFALS